MLSSTTGRSHFMNFLMIPQLVLILCGNGSKSLKNILI